MTKQNREEVGRPVVHESSELHVTGGAHYIDDLPTPADLLHAAVGVSERAHADLVSVDLDPVRAAPGVVDVIGAGDLPAANDLGGRFRDEPILAPDVATYAGQSLFAVAAESVRQARQAARVARIEYAEREPVLEIDEAVKREDFVVPSVRVARGDAAARLEAADHRLTGRFRMGGQDQFYLEGHISLALPQEDGRMHVHCSTQHPGEVQAVVAEALGVEFTRVSVECRRMGGGFGGKETQSALFAALAAVLARRTGRPVKLRLDRDADMVITGKRHDFISDYDVGFDSEGRIEALAVTLASRCGISADLSGPVNDRAVFHVDNCYYLSDVDIASHRCRTNTVSNTAFRGFGGPQGMLAIEWILDEIARSLRLDPLDVRQRNFYGIGSRDVTPYGMSIEDNILPELIPALEQSSEYRRRRQEVEEFNEESPILKRGLALTPVKFGISFTATHLNQAGALVHIYTDGTVLLNHGGTEMGQGLFTKVAQVAADELGVGLDRVRCTSSHTEKVPNASATAASAGSDLNGMAARAACKKLRRRLTEFAAREYGVKPRQVRFSQGRVHVGGRDVPFEEVVQRAWMARVSLSATGFYRTPKIHYDPETLTGRPFYYFAYGAAVSQAIVDTLTGESRIERVDILHDVGESLNPAIDMGQIEGGFIQGMGWLTTEELWWDDRGHLGTHAPSTYKIPVANDLPREWNVEILSTGRNREPTIHRSKAVGEPPLMLAISAFLAIKDAIASVGGSGARPALEAPATPENVLRALEHLSSSPSEDDQGQTARR